MPEFLVNLASVNKLVISESCLVNLLSHSGAFNIPHYWMLVFAQAMHSIYMHLCSYVASHANSCIQCMTNNVTETVSVCP